MSNLKDYLKEFEAETLPGDIEPEADESETVAQVTENDTSHYDQTAQKSNLRPIEMLNDPKYTGVKVTREQLDQSSDDESADEDMEDDDEEEMLSKINQEKETKIDGNEEDEDYTKLYAVEGKIKNKIYGYIENTFWFYSSAFFWGRLASEIQMH
jgi:hypothetical protein